LSLREPGTVLDGKYEIVQRLGSGGMGEVYLVRHMHLQELRVVKILRQDLAADPVAQKRFVREARLATQIKHPNVAILYDFSRLPDGSFYMVWEHIEGQDIGDWVRRNGPLPTPLAIRLGIQALRGLEAVHTAGIIHRDLSPDNLMLMENARKQPWIKIIDLGLAKNLETDAGLEITQVGMFMGKLQYCSPEQAGAAQGMTLDRRTDIYSFGLVFYEMLTGLPPFESENQHGFVFKRLSEDPLPLVGRNPKVAIPSELDRLVRRALERDRERRYADAVSFIQALERVDKGLSAVETKEIAMPGGVAPTPVAPAVRLAPHAPLERPAGAVTPARPRSASELSREERLDLLAQIEKAARRPADPGTEASRIEGALAAGRVGEAQKLFARLEAANPRTPVLERLREQIAGAVGAELARRAGEAERALAGAVAQASEAAAAGRLEEAKRLAESLAAEHPGAPSVAGLRQQIERAELAADVKRRTGEAEQVLGRYLQGKQLALARLALDTLLELAPEHPNRKDYENWVALLAEEVEQEKRSDVALAAGRAAVARRDFKAARHELAVLSRNDLSVRRAEDLGRELEEAERGLKQGAEFEELKKRLDTHLRERQVAAAERDIEQLAGLGLGRVTLDSYRERLAEVRAVSEQAGRLAPFEKRYRDHLHARDWFAARETATELDQALPGNSRAAAMFGEIERLESIHHRQRAVEQGVRQVDEFIAKGELEKADLAFRILLQLDPDNRHRKRLERQLKTLHKSRT
jgi:tRNA A-37 threonylcarbamoyl transferase component Bud32